MLGNEEIRDAVKQVATSGDDIINKCRTILSSRAWLAGEAPEELFEVFSAIASDTDYVSLSGEKAVKSGLRDLMTRENPGFKDDMEDVYDTYIKPFTEAQRELEKYLYK